MDYENNKTENELQPNGGAYLWDGSGVPDPEVQKLETLLGKFRHDRPIPVFPEIVPIRRWWMLSKGKRLFPVAATAGAIAAMALAMFLVYQRTPAPITVAGWNVSHVTGTPRIGLRVLGEKEDGRLSVGQVLETDPQSKASLRAEDIGQIEVEPNTRLRLLAMGPTQKRIALDRGTIHTYIWAPAGQFVVDTPSAVTVDLGCAYTLQVDDSGAGLVRTSLGWVGFTLKGREAFIPAGAACATRPNRGPGTPYFEDSSATLRAALAKFDFEDESPQQRAGDLAIVLVESRPRDVLTLWHLLVRVDKAQRSFVYDRLAKLVPPPAGVTRQGVLLLDQHMLDLWWNELGFDDIAVWRHWERSWGGTSASGRDQ